MTAKFTPGPWGAIDHSVLDSATCTPIATVYRIANAHLIAACPTMAEYIIMRAMGGDKDAEKIAHSFGWEAEGHLGEGK